MTESRNNTKTWTTKQIWIKDVLNKSGTELMDISKTKTKAAIKKAPAKGKSFSGKLHTNFGPHSRLDAILFWYTKIGLWGGGFWVFGGLCQLKCERRRKREGAPCRLESSPFGGNASKGNFL